MKRDAESDGADIVFVPFVEYDSGDPEFIRGAEIGYLEAKIELLGSVTIRELVRQSNGEMLQRLTAAAGRTFSTETLDDEWMSVTIDPLPLAGRPPSQNGSYRPPA